MKYVRNIQRKLISLIILIFILLVSILVFLNLTYAQKELHEETLYEISKNTPKQHPHITAGTGPVAIAVDFFTDTIYVANSRDGTVSVIDGRNNAKIGDDIKVGDYPSAIGVDTDFDRVYVANSRDDTVSAIDGKNNSKIGDDIKVGNAPVAIGIGYDTIYVANEGDGTVSIIDRNNNSKIGDDIKVGSLPSAIAVDKHNDTIYVANGADGTVSVIDGKNNSKIGDDIKVGAVPSAIGIDYDTIYVANQGDNTVSVIDRNNNSKIGDDIKVGRFPSAIGVLHDIKFDRVYVANWGDDTVSVIDGKNNSKVGDDIKVGDFPSAIGIVTSTETIYVANSGDDTISVMDAYESKVVARVMFNTEPFNSGHIECDKDRLIAPIKQQFYLWSGSECTARPTQGFEFVSWQENLNGNSTKLIKLSSPPSILDSILDFLHINPDKPEATLNISKFGSFTANFKALPPPIPSEYLLGLFTIVASTIVGWSIPSILSWTNSKRQARVVFTYHLRINSLYDDSKIDESDTKNLHQLNADIANDYSKGKISDKQYENIKNEISALYQEIYKKKIDSWNQISDKVGVNELDNIVSEMQDAYAIGKLNELHYTLLKDRVSENKNNRKPTSDELH